MHIKLLLLCINALSVLVSMATCRDVTTYATYCPLRRAVEVICVRGRGESIVRCWEAIQKHLFNAEDITSKHFTSPSIRNASCDRWVANWDGHMERKTCCMNTLATADLAWNCAELYQRLRDEYQESNCIGIRADITSCVSATSPTSVCGIQYTR
jgi:hypothetical protein